jgi:hypothetical protein
MNNEKISTGYISTDPWNQNQTLPYTPPSYTINSGIMTSYNKVSKLELTNVEVSKEFLNQLFELVASQNIPLSLEGVTIKKEPKDKVKDEPKKGSYEQSYEEFREQEIANVVNVSKPLSQETEATDKEIEQIIALIKEEEALKKIEASKWTSTAEETTNAPVLTVDGSATVSVPTIDKVDTLTLINESQGVQPKEKVGEEVLPQVIKVMAGEGPVKPKILSNEPLSFLEKIQLEELEQKEKAAYNMADEYNRMKRNRLEVLKEKYKYKV